MAEIRPFCALRFDTQAAGNIQELTCPPYDIISEEQRNQYLKTNEHNVIRLVKTLMRRREACCASGNNRAF